MRAKASYGNCVRCFFHTVNIHSTHTHFISFTPFHFKIRVVLFRSQSHAISTRTRCGPSGALSLHLPLSHHLSRSLSECGIWVLVWGLRLSGSYCGTSCGAFTPFKWSFLLCWLLLEVFFQLFFWLLRLPHLALFARRVVCWVFVNFINATVAQNKMHAVRVNFDWLPKRSEAGEVNAGHFTQLPRLISQNIWPN